MPRNTNLCGVKVVSFFSAKGGTCKTTMNMLFAGFLRYQLGKRVIVMDFDGPEYNLYNTRERELLYAEKNGITIDTDGLYPIQQVEDASAQGVKEVRSFIEELRPHFDYLVMDFPGSFADGDAVCRLALARVFDLLVIPVELDGMIVASAKSLAGILQELGQETLLFFNKVHGKEKPALYEALTAWFDAKGMKVSPHRVKNSLKMRRDADNGLTFSRSTVQFPLKEIKDNNPGILGLFEEVVRNGTEHPGHSPDG